MSENAVAAPQLSVILLHFFYYRSIAPPVLLVHNEVMINTLRGMPQR